MASYNESVCRICRRENLKLFLKGERCYTDKCAIERRPYPPGQHGQSRRKFSDYGIQLREKQKVRRSYGLLEKQFRGTFVEADRLRGVTGENLLVLLERRMDNAVYRMGFSSTRSEARQLIRHNHFLVNGRKVNLPSRLLRVGDEVQVREKSRELARIKGALAALERRGLPGWLELDEKTFKGMVKALPSRDELTMPMREQLIVELYSK